MKELKPNDFAIDIFFLLLLIHGKDYFRNSDEFFFFYCCSYSRIKMLSELREKWYRFYERMQKRIPHIIIDYLSIRRKMITLIWVPFTLLIDSVTIQNAIAKSKTAIYEISLRQMILKYIQLMHVFSIQYTRIWWRPESTNESNKSISYSFHNKKKKKKKKSIGTLKIWFSFWVFRPYRFCVSHNV